MRNKKINWVLTAGAFVMLAMPMGARSSGMDKQMKTGAKARNRAEVMNIMTSMQQDVTRQMGDMAGAK